MRQDIDNNPGKVCLIDPVALLVTLDCMLNNTAPSPSVATPTRRVELVLDALLRGSVIRVIATAPCVGVEIEADS